MDESRTADWPNPGAYQATPNTAVPHNNRQRGEVASIALQQLVSYQQQAVIWPMVRHEHEGRYYDDVLQEYYSLMRSCWCCTICDPCKTLWFVNDLNGDVFSYTPDEIGTLKVAHIRQVHDKDGTNGGRRQD